MKYDGPWLVYSLSDPRSLIIRYIGVTASQRLSRRLSQHLSDGRPWKTKPTHKARWIAELRRIGMEPFISVIERGRGNWQEREAFWIAHFNALGCGLTNKTDGGDGALGYSHTPETRKLLAEKNRGRRLSEWHRSRLYSPESRAKISAAQIGKRHLTDAQYAAIGEKQKGRRHSPQAIEKMAASKRGRPRSSETRRKLALANTGKHHSAETRARMSASHHARFQRINGGALS